MIRVWNSAALWLLAALWRTAAGAAEPPCHPIEHEGQAYTICAVAAGADLRLVLNGADGHVLGTFERFEAMLGGKVLGFAMNAGMYHPDRRPVGLFIDEGRELAPLVTRAGPGNFSMLPNGVFCIGTAGFSVIESRRFAKAPPQCRFASQSGPMLVIDGKLHPRFIEGSLSRHIRNGVGVSADGQRAVFAISAAPVNFDEFARLFRDALSLPQALYFDGSVSRLYAPAIGRRDFGLPMGPMVGLAVAPE